MKNSVTGAILFLAVLSLSACGTDESTNAETNADVSVRVSRVVAVEVPHVNKYPGSVQGQQKVQLSTLVTGRIVFLGVEAGEKVERGQILARIQSDNIEAQRSQVLASMDEAKVELVSAETHRNRMTSLFESESATKKEFEDAETRYQIVEARIAALVGKVKEIDDVLDYTVLRAPINGVVVQKLTEVGGLATPGMPLLVLEDTEHLEVIASVPEREIKHFALGDTLDIEVRSVNEDRIEGVVKQINTASQSASRQYEVQISVPTGASAELMSGMFVRVLTSGTSRKVVSVPNSAIVRRGQMTGLYTVSDAGKAVLRWVRTGKQLLDRVEILSGLGEGETIVISYSGRIADGVAVSVGS